MSVALEIHRTDEDDEFDEVEASAAVTHGVHSSTKLFRPGPDLSSKVNVVSNLLIKRVIVVALHGS